MVSPNIYFNFPSPCISSTFYVLYVPYNGTNKKQLFQYHLTCAFICNTEAVGSLWGKSGL